MQGSPAGARPSVRESVRLSMGECIPVYRTGQALVLTSVTTHPKALMDCFQASNARTHARLQQATRKVELLTGPSSPIAASRSRGWAWYPQRRPSSWRSRCRW